MSVMMPLRRVTTAAAYANATLTTGSPALVAGAVVIGTFPYTVTLQNEDATNTVIVSEDGTDESVRIPPGGWYTFSTMPERLYFKAAAGTPVVQVIVEKRSPAV